MTAATGFPLAAYKDRRMLRIFLLGIMSGFPWVLIGTALTLWLKENAVSRSDIGWAGLIFSVYAFNYLWAPLIDKIRIPWLTERVGHRKAWILVCQLFIAVALTLWCLFDPSNQLKFVIAVGLIISVASASQDITIDALRIEQIDAKETDSMAAGAAMAVIGWWTGFKAMGALMLFVADKFEAAGYADVWPMTFVTLCGFIVLCSLLLLLVPEASSAARIARQQADQAAIEAKLGDGHPRSRFVAWLASAVTGPLASFFKQNGVAIAWSILGFIFLFKIGEAFMGRMSLVFYQELGFSRTDIAIFSKTLGWITTIVFTLLGSWFAIRAGVVKALFISGIAMACTNLMFALLAQTGKNEWLFALAVVVDDIAAAFATVAFVTFISLLVDRTYTATQYALLASLGTLGKTLVSSSSGQAVDYLGGNWTLFFIITTLMVIPSLILLWIIRHRLNLHEPGIRIGRKSA